MSTMESPASKVLKLRLRELYLGRGGCRGGGVGVLGGHGGGEAGFRGRDVFA